VFDVSDPTAPRLVATTDEHGVQGPWNDFIHHNAARPNAAQFRPGAAPSLGRGNVLLVTEEDYENTDCATAGSFQTWHVSRLDGSPGTITPLDRLNPVDLGEGVSAPHMAFCSAHWFDVHQSGIVAQGFYEGGLRLVDVRDPRDIKEYGYVASGLSEVWDAYWVPQRNSKGVARAAKTNIVYTVDAVRGLDVYTVDLPGSTSSTPLLGGLGGPDPAVSVLAVGLLGLTGLALLQRRRLAAAHARG
jgi:MYXO-CTERM domain-containing protein